MDKEHAIALLKGGVDGVREFNRRRAAGDALPELFEVDLSGQKLVGSDSRGRSEPVDLHDAILIGANLCGARLPEANLRSAELFDAALKETMLYGADLTSAKLTGAHLQQARLRDATLHGARLEHADLRDTDLHGATLTLAICEYANFSGASLRRANLTGADLRHANLTDCDLRGTTGLRLDDTLIRGAHFDARAADPWSVLRRTYTGPALLFNLIFMCVFIGAYAIKAAMWIGVNRAQQAGVGLANGLRERAVSLAGDHPAAADALAAVADALGELEPTLTEHSRQMPIWKVLIAMDQGVATMVLAAALLLYNALRWVVTRQVAAMRDAEERSGYSPAWRAWRGYAGCYWVHHWILSSLFWFAAVAFVYHAWRWLTGTVYLPK